MSSSEPDFWPHQGPVAERGGPHFAELIDEVRRLQSRLVTAQLPADVALDVTRRLREVSDTLAAHETSSRDAACGARLDLPGRGHPFLPPIVIDDWTDDEVRGHVTFTEYFAGGNSAAAGGLGVLFGDLLGRLSVGGGRAISRAAYVHVNFRSPTSLGRRLDVEATIDRIEGRKRFISGRLIDGDALIADAEGLFVELQARPY